MSFKDKTILIVDDDPDLRKLARKILEGKGLRVEEAGGVKEALSTFDRIVPHVVVLDLMLGEEDGFAFLEQRRLRPALNKTPVLVLSARTDAPAIKQAIAMGASNYLNKPLNANLLLQKIRKVLIQAASNQEPTEYKYVAAKPRVKCTVNGKVIGVSEDEIQIESPIKLDTERPLHVTSKLLSDIGLEREVLRTSTQPSVISENGQYLSRARIIGVSDAQKMQIRKMIKHWR